MTGNFLQPLTKLVGACIQIKRILHACLSAAHQSKSGGWRATPGNDDDDDNQDEMASGNRLHRPIYRIKVIIFPRERKTRRWVRVWRRQTDRTQSSNTKPATDIERPRSTVQSTRIRQITWTIPCINR